MKCEFFAGESRLTMFLWLKLLHIFLIVGWFAGLFYLPRIYVNLAQAEPESQEYLRLVGMAWRLWKFMTPLGVGAVLCGLLMPALGGWWRQGWVHGKILIGLILAAYHVHCYFLLQRFHRRRNRHSHKWFRLFNEVPVLLLLSALYLVVFKPF